jgi:hypothetical protein
VTVPAEDRDEVGEVERWSDVYEAALRRNDVDQLNGLFLDHPDVLRFGVADEQHGYAELIAWRAGAPAISADRRITGRWIVRLAPGVVAVDLTFADDDHHVGRQSQTWVRTDVGWRISRAHVSLVER